MKLKKRIPIVSDILLLDGITRAGKFLLGKVISHFEGIEYFQYVPALEHIPILWKTGILSEESAVAYLQLNVDMFVYDRIIGRNLNTRFSDHSAIQHSTNYREYLLRSRLADGMPAIRKFKNKKRTPSFLVHETLPMVKIFFQGFPQLRVVNIQRHPVDVIHSWDQRGWGVKFFKPDLLSYIPTFEDSSSRTFSRPWFSLAWRKDYKFMKPIDRVIQSVLTVNALEWKTYNTLPVGQKKRVRFICYEQLIKKPKLVIEEISLFLRAKPKPHMKELLRREGCYRKLKVEEGRKKLHDIRRRASGRFIDLLGQASEAYESSWGLDSYL